MDSAGLLRYRLPPAVGWIVAALAFLAAGQALQSGVHLNHDVSWILHSARWLLAGRSFGLDVLDPSPPMSWVPSFPAAAIVNAGVMLEPGALRLSVWIYFLISLGLLIRVSNEFQGAEKIASYGCIAAFIMAGALTPAFSFGQREHLCVLFAMPYLAIAVLRMHKVKAIPASVAICAGVLAGVGFSIKPFFFAVPLLVETGLVLKVGWRSILRREFLALMSIAFCYALAVSVLMPDFLSRVVPLIRDVYWAYDTSSRTAMLDRYWMAVEPAAYGMVAVLVSRRWTCHQTVLLLAGAGFSISYFVQSKGFVYHAYPVLLCALVFLGVSVANAISAARSRKLRAEVGLSIVIVLVTLSVVIPPIKHSHDAVVSWYFQYSIKMGRTGQFRQAVIELINRYAEGPGQFFYALSTHPFPGFPTASYVSAEWSGRAATQFAIPAFARLDEVQDSERKARIVAAAGVQREIVIEDLRRHPPEVVLVERSRFRLGMSGRYFDDLAFYLMDPDFAEIWNRYEELPPFGSLRVFKMKEGALNAR